MADAATVHAGTVLLCTSEDGAEIYKDVDSQELRSSKVGLGERVVATGPAVEEDGFFRVPIRKGAVELDDFEIDTTSPKRGSRAASEELDDAGQQLEAARREARDARARAVEIKRKAQQEEEETLAEATAELDRVRKQAEEAQQQARRAKQDAKLTSQRSMEIQRQIDQAKRDAARAQKVVEDSDLAKREAEEAAKRQCRGMLNVRIHAAYNLVSPQSMVKKSGFDDDFEPFVCASVGSIEQKTHSIQDFNPVWNSKTLRFHIDTREPLQRTLAIDVVDKSSEMKAGTLSIDLPYKVKAGPPQTLREMLQNGSGGELEFEVCWLPDAEAKAHQVHVRGTLMVRVMAAQNLKSTSEVDDIPDPFVVASVGKQTYKTETIQDDISPVWNARHFVYELDTDEPDERMLHLQVFNHKQLQSPELLGRFKLDIADLPFDVTRKHTELMIGGGQISFQTYLTKDVDDSQPSTSALLFQASDFYGGPMLPAPRRSMRRASQPQTVRGTLLLRILAAYNLRNVDTGVLGELPDPCVKMAVGSTQHSTQAVGSTLNPVWNSKQFRFPVSSTAKDGQILRIEVLNDKTMKLVDSLGKLDIEIMKLEPGTSAKVRQVLRNGLGAELEVEVCFVIEQRPEPQPGRSSISLERKPQSRFTANEIFEVAAASIDKPAKEPPSREEVIERHESRQQKLIGKPIAIEGPDERIKGTLMVRFIAAYDLQNSDSGYLGDVSDAFAVARVGQLEFRTLTVENTLNPFWDSQFFSFPVDTNRPDEDKLHIEVFNDNMEKEAHTLGRLEVYLRTVPAGVTYRKRERLLDSVSGEVEVEIRLIAGHDSEIEHMMMDGQAARKATRSSHGTSGLLTVRVLAAHRLMQADSGIYGDTSDPFVVVRLGHAEFKTETLEDNLDPVWNAKPFRFKVKNLQDEILKLGVFNDNQTQQADLLGRAEFKLATLVSGNPLRRREKLISGSGGELEFEMLFVKDTTQKKKGRNSKQAPSRSGAEKQQEEQEHEVPEGAGKEKGDKSWLAAFSGFGEQETKKEEKVHTGNLLVRVVAAFSLLNMDTGEDGNVSDPYVVANVGKVNFRTDTIQNNLNPVWKPRQFLFPIDLRLAGKDVLNLEVFDDNEKNKASSLGRTEIDVVKLVPGVASRKREHLRDGGKGQLEVEVCFVPDAQSKEDDVAVTAGKALLSRTLKSGKLSVRILSAVRLMNMDYGGGLSDVSDAFVNVRVGKTEFRTETVNNNLNPRWQSKEFTFTIEDCDAETLYIEVFNDNADSHRRNDSLGKLDLGISEILPNAPPKRRMKLRDGGKGELEFEAKFVVDKPEPKKPAASGQGLLSVSGIGLLGSEMLGLHKVAKKMKENMDVALSEGGDAVSEYFEAHKQAVKQAEAIQLVKDAIRKDWEKDNESVDMVKIFPVKMIHSEIREELQEAQALREKAKSEVDEALFLRFQLMNEEHNAKSNMLDANEAGRAAAARRDQIVVNGANEKKKLAREAVQLKYEMSELEEQLQKGQQEELQELKLASDEQQTANKERQAAAAEEEKAKKLLHEASEARKHIQTVKERAQADAWKAMQQLQFVARANALSQEGQVRAREHEDLMQALAAADEEQRRMAHSEAAHAREVQQQLLKEEVCVANLLRERERLRRELDDLSDIARWAPSIRYRPLQP